MLYFFCSKSEEAEEIQISNSNIQIFIYPGYQIFTNLTKIKVWAVSVSQSMTLGLTV